MKLGRVNQVHNLLDNARDRRRGAVCGHYRFQWNLSSGMTEYAANLSEVIPRWQQNYQLAGYALKHYLTTRLFRQENNRAFGKANFLTFCFNV